MERRAKFRFLRRATYRKLGKSKEHSMSDLQIFLILSGIILITLIPVYLFMALKAQAPAGEDEALAKGE
jgi:hypothetical protein